MHNQNRLLKVLKLISSLKATPPKSVKLLAKQFDISERTLYRYIDLLKESGFEIHKDGVNKMFIPQVDRQFASVFTSNEVDYLKNTLQHNQENTIVKNSILLKLHLYNEIEALSLDITQAHLASLMQAFKQAIAAKMQVVLASYLSVNSNTVSDRRIEPIAFTPDFKFIFGYEIATQKNKLFALDRIKEVITTTTPFKFENLHQLNGVDIFNFTNTGAHYSLHLLLNIRAYVLLKREFPQIEPHIQPNIETKQFELQAIIYSLTPMIRFIKGLPNDLQVIAPQELINALKTI